LTDQPDRDKCPEERAFDQAQAGYRQCDCGDLITKHGEAQCARCRQPRVRCVSKIEGAADILGLDEGFLKIAIDNEHIRRKTSAHPHGPGCACSECFVENLERIRLGEEEPLAMGLARLEQNADNWKHRSKGMKCATCMWYAPKESLRPSFRIGRCRRNAPTLGGWPVMIDSDWCGNHKLDEEKV
jgi:hypothetical protein